MSCQFGIAGCSRNANVAGLEKLQLQEACVSNRTRSLLVCAALVLAGCQNGSSLTEQISTGVGAVVGGVGGYFAGDAIGGTGAKIAGTAIGTAAGAWIGNQVGRYLDERERERLAEATQRTAVTGEPESWQNPEDGTTIETRVTDTQTRREPVSVPVLKDRVEEIPPLDLIGAPYRAVRDANVRGGPGTDYAVAGTLSTGEQRQVVGKVQGADWYLISEGGAGSGFVAANLLEPLPPSVAAASQPASPTGPVETRTVQSERVCRTIEQSVTTAEGPRTEKVTACQGPEGWEII